MVVVAVVDVDTPLVRGTAKAEKHGTNKQRRNDETVLDTKDDKIFIGVGVIQP